MKLVEEILAETSEPSSAYLEILANYLTIPMERKERRERRILTENRMSTVNRHETSFEGLATTLENGEDGIYNLIQENKNAIFRPKISITKKDLAEVPFLAQLRQAINDWEALLKASSGKDSYIIKKALIEMRKDQYLLKNSFRGPIIFNKLIHPGKIIPPLVDTTTFEDNELQVSGISLMDYTVCSAILCNYSKLKENSFGVFDGDTWYLIEDFDKLADKTFREYPLYERLIELKIDGRQNTEIQHILEEEFQIKHSIEYISSLWRNKLPKMLAEEAQKEYILWYYKRYNLPLKRCSRCGALKPAHNHFFSKNKTSKDGWYSICKDCRNKKE